MTEPAGEPGVTTRGTAWKTPDVRVLLCDDQAVIRDVLRKVVGALPGFRVMGETATGPDLLQALQTVPADLVVIDVNLPGGGPTLAAILRQAHPSLTILVFSADCEPHLQQAMLEAGADAYVVKTGRIAPLRAALLAHADRARGGRGGHQEMDGLRLNGARVS